MNPPYPAAPSNLPLYSCFYSRQCCICPISSYYFSFSSYNLLKLLPRTIPSYYCFLTLFPHTTSLYYFPILLFLHTIPSYYPSYYFSFFICNFTSHYPSYSSFPSISPFSVSLLPSPPSAPRNLISGALGACLRPEGPARLEGQSRRPRY